LEATDLKRLFIFFLINLIFIVLFSTGCTKTTNPTPRPEEEQPAPQVEEPPIATQNLSVFFPLTEGSTWVYQGEGNEFAAFNREVLFVEGDKAQIREDNGGTVSAAVFKTTDNEIIRIFFQGEEYDNTNFLNQEPNDSLVILKTPLEVGTKWEEPNGVREIVEMDARVDTPAGQFKNCIKVKISGEESTLYEYFKDEIGMVKREFISGDTYVTSSLEKFMINP